MASTTARVMTMRRPRRSRATRLHARARRRSSARCRERSRPQVTVYVRRSMRSSSRSWTACQSFQGRAQPCPNRRVEGGPRRDDASGQPERHGRDRASCGDIQAVRGGLPRRTRSRPATAVTNRGPTMHRRRSDNRDRYDNRDARSPPSCATTPARADRTISTETHFSPPQAEVRGNHPGVISACPESSMRAPATPQGDTRTARRRFTRPRSFRDLTPAGRRQEATTADQTRCAQRRCRRACGGSRE